MKIIVRCTCGPCIINNYENTIKKEAYKCISRILTFTAKMVTIHLGYSTVVAESSSTPVSGYIRRS